MLGNSRRIEETTHPNRFFVSDTHLIFGALAPQMSVATCTPVKSHPPPNTHARRCRRQAARAGRPPSAPCRRTISNRRKRLPITNSGVSVIQRHQRLKPREQVIYGALAILLRALCSGPDIAFFAAAAAIAVMTSPLRQRFATDSAV